MTNLHCVGIISRSVSHFTRNLMHHIHHNPLSVPLFIIYCWRLPLFFSPFSTFFHFVRWLCASRSSGSHTCERRALYGFKLISVVVFFQDNIASGFQNLFDRGDLVDVTLACDGKLLQAHKIVLAICSPYFQEMFITNPCRHPISKY